MTTRFPSFAANIPLSSIYVDGGWKNADGQETFGLTDPGNGEALCQVTLASTADADRCVEAARRVFDDGDWPRLSLEERLVFVRKLAEALHARGDELGHSWTRQVGVLYSMSSNSLDYSVGSIERFIKQARSIAFMEEHPRVSGNAFLSREPVGVVAAIAPWNAPLLSMLNKVAPALITGCTVVMKPSPETPVEAFIIAQCAHEIGLPPGVCNLFVADREVSEHLVRHPWVDKVSFTGSVATGKRIAALCSERIGRVTLELGGKSAAIVCDDYDLNEAAANLVQSLIMMSGQNCAALTRVIVSRDRHDALVEKLGAEMAKVTIGDPYDPGVALGPLAMKRQLDRVEEFVAIGRSEGADLVYGGQRPDRLGNGFYIQPTLFANVSNEMRIAREEIFGPLLCVIPADDEDDAVRIANDSEFGLAGGVYTNDRDKALAIARKMRTGTISHNCAMADFDVGFGGFKQSGLGREGGIPGLLAYTEAKTILLA